jgi:hypothetical protein
MTLESRNRELVDRIDHLERMETELRQLFSEGKTEQLLQGVDADGGPFAPLAPSTLRNRPGSGPPLVPRYRDSAIIRAYTVTITTIGAGLRIVAGWPTLAWVKYHQSGTKHMPQRDPGGFRNADAELALKRLRDFVFKK